MGLPSDADMGNSEVGAGPVLSGRHAFSPWPIAAVSLIKCRVFERVQFCPACRWGTPRQGRALHLFHVHNVLPCLQVGHNALGAGQVVDQGAKCVDNALASGGGAPHFVSHRSDAAHELHTGWHVNASGVGTCRGFLGHLQLLKQSKAYLVGPSHDASIVHCMAAWRFT